MQNLAELIDERLWEEIKRNYLNEQYSNSVLDGIQFLSDLIREMSGEDGDGYNLMGRVFNTKNPKIKVNKLRTTTEKDIQNGVMLILQGFYRAIRNQRVHEKKIDSEQEAFEIILFLNHILRIVDQSKGKFTIENTLKRVFDDNLLPRKDYVDHIIKEIPDTKKYDIAIKVFRRREESRSKSNLGVFWNLLMKDLKPKELEDLHSEISDTLRYATKSEAVSSVVFLVGDDWKNLEQDSRLRAENLLIKSLPSYLTDDPRDNRIPSANYYNHVAIALHKLYVTDLLLLVKEFSSKIFTLFDDSTSYALDAFVINHFGGFLEELDEFVLFKSLDAILKKKLENNNRHIVEFIEEFLPEDKASKLKEYLPDNDMDDDLPF